MRFEIRFLDSTKHPIHGFVDALMDSSECREYHIHVSYLDHRKNSAIVTATGEFGEYMKERFKNNKGLVFTLPEGYHNPFHAKYLDKDGYQKCGCGWIESEQEHIKRTMIITTETTNPKDLTLEMKIVSRNEIPK